MCNLDLYSFQLLIMRQFDGVEKIKTIGSTYMAAAGLQYKSDDQQVFYLIVQNKQTVVTASQTACIFHKFFIRTYQKAPIVQHPHI